MYPSKNIVEKAIHSKNHTTLAVAVKAADLVPTLESRGPFTAFAPTNVAFGKLLTSVERISHWINAVTIIIMISIGWLVYNCIADLCLSLSSTG
jgi:uncharacterized surface protein with fasciclin (FAS1) repeats